MKIKRFFLMLFLALLYFGSGYVMPQAEAASTDEWVWIASDEKYGKFFSPSRVKVLDSVNGVATCLEAWTKTVYTYEGAKETIQNYELQSELTNPSQLAYSLAQVQVHPQTRTIEYVRENFYDADGKELWSKVYTNRTVKEINSRSFDEGFYVSIVDTVFRHGEAARQKAEDRWIPLWQISAADGSSTTCIADTTTMRLKGDNLIFWAWIEEKDTQQNVREVKFLKEAVNLPEGTKEVLHFQYWNADKGWQDLSGELELHYTSIKEGSYEADGLKKLRAYAAGYQYWLNRYSLAEAG